MSFWIRNPSKLSSTLRHVQQTCVHRGRCGQNSHLHRAMFNKPVSTEEDVPPESGNVDQNFHDDNAQTLIAVCAGV